MKLGLNFTGIQTLELQLKHKSDLRFEGVCYKNITEMYNRAKNEGIDPKRGGTPHDSGELRKTASIVKPRRSENFWGEIGYIKDYAPHVEYGHRTIDGGFVQGQRFLQHNLEEQQKTYKQDLIDHLKKG